MPVFVDDRKVAVFIHPGGNGPGLRRVGEVYDLPRIEIFPRSPRSLRDALACLPSTSTLACSNSNCTRERLTSFSVWAKNRSRRWPLASSGTLSWRSCGSIIRHGQPVGPAQPWRPPRAPSPRPTSSRGRRYPRAEESAESRRGRPETARAPRSSHRGEDDEAATTARRRARTGPCSRRAGCGAGRTPAGSQARSSRTTEDHGPGQLWVDSIVTIQPPGRRWK